ncbi:LptF/LptG family permease [Zavarzinella formosa]|uniref:LptF/LptG family permease n=1 Tax=Zavarzinella formosa TaxID=360055 RepID=UPI0002FAF068|nr:LptF/LptG family permease [Zavarzinella formosa]
MTILDRMLFAAFLRSYFICLTSMMSLYVVVDLFTNIDDFFVPGRRITEVLEHIGTYYGYRMLQFYDRLCEAISLLAAMFTIAIVQRNNELIPVLSAGVSTHRLLRPIFIGAIMMLSLGIINQELIIPRIAGALVTDREDFDGTRDLVVQGTYDANRVHVEGVRATRKEMKVERFYVTLPETAASRMTHISAQFAQYVPPQENVPLSGGWMLTGASPPEISEGSFDPKMIKLIDPGKYFVWVREATFTAVTRGQKTLGFASTSEMFQLMHRTDVGRMNQLAVNFHMRMTRPIIGMILVIMGISIILRDQTRHVIISSGMCLGLCALFFGSIYVSKYLGNGDYVSPAMAAWIPVLIFGPFAAVLYDAIHT